MNNEKEIKLLHSKGFVILRASQTTNAPIGWKRKTGSKKWGYVDEMNDPKLMVYKSTFDAKILSKSHCGFYLGHGNLCCIDLDTKKTTIEETTKLKNQIVKSLKDRVMVETTKSNGYHIYFLYAKRLDNCPDWMRLGKDNWIELYYSKRFIACYLSHSNRYKIIHGDLLQLKELSIGEHTKLLSCIAPLKGKEQKIKKKKQRAKDIGKAEWEEAENFVRQIEEQGLDITGDNPRWFKIGKSIASAFGEKGFDLFNRISQFSDKYNEDTIHDDYMRFVEDDARPRKDKVSIATFFHICKDEYDLHSLEITNALRLNPSAEVKEFELPIDKKESKGEKIHTLCNVFRKHVEICCIDKATFYVFHETHWKRQSSRNVTDLLRSFITRSEVDESVRKQLYTFDFMEHALKELALFTHLEAIEAFTGNLRDGIFINMENGVLHVDLKSGKRKLLDHESKYNFTNVLPFSYDPAAVCHRFDKWIDKQMPNKEAQQAYFAFVASCLTKHKADIIMLLTGDTATGKSSLIEITRRLIGLENSTAVSASILFSGRPEGQTQVIQMENKLLAYDFDAQPFKDQEMLLKVATQEPVTGWQMHITRRVVSNYGRLLIAMNPNNYSVFNPAIARRLITINMDVPVVKDNSVIPDIYENELAGIFNHILNKGVKHLLENNGQIRVSHAMKEATVQFHTQSLDSVRWFKSRYMVPKAPKETTKSTTMLQKLRSSNPGCEIIFSDLSTLYQEFRTWAEMDEGYSIHKLPIRKFFAKDLKLIGVDEAIFKVEGRAVRGIYLIKQ